MQNINLRFGRLSSIFITLAAIFWCSSSLAHIGSTNGVAHTDCKSLDLHTTLPQLMIADASANEQGNAEQPAPGSLVIPGEEKQQSAEKKCVRVCDKWGERCNINPRTGQRRCMRICKQFGEDCF